ncbi:hypothetical protein Acr_06g0004860 [Actinidia rufa]|uniref:ZF-HD dimerization-type domain-containing protein n=1 Tax=Actinidia rufa TaxID=165716 RepID=A0A7J0EQS9_9ERIC|nr:hypothetical protein Acr_06g0004860 [Actinidia rufa]
MAPKKKASGDGSSRVVRYMECRRNRADASSGATTDALDGCRAFKKVSTAEPEVCATCGCHRSFHRKDVVYRVPSRSSPVHFATMAAAIASPLAILYHRQNKKHRHLRLHHCVGWRLMRN